MQRSLLNNHYSCTWWRIYRFVILHYAIIYKKMGK